MKHEVKSKIETGENKYLLAVQLLPESDFEKMAIKNMEVDIKSGKSKVSAMETDMIRNYLKTHLKDELGSYIISSFENQQDGIVVLNTTCIKSNGKISRLGHK